MKKRSKLDKVLLGFVIGSAVAGAVGAAQTKKGKEIRKKVSGKILETSEEIRKKIEKKAKNKDSVWHKLNKIFFSKK